MKTIRLESGATVVKVLGLDVDRQLAAVLVASGGSRALDLVYFNEIRIEIDGVYATPAELRSTLHSAALAVV